MKKIILFVLLLLIPASAQVKKFRADTIRAEKAIKIKGTDRTSFFDNLNSSNQLKTSGIADSAVTSNKIQDSTIIKRDLSKELLDYVGSGGSVTNNPDGVTTHSNAGDEIYVDTTGTWLLPRIGKKVEGNPTSTDTVEKRGLWKVVAGDGASSGLLGAGLYDWVNDTVRIKSAFIAAFNAPAKDRALANFVCDGIDDEQEIQQAIDAGFNDIVLSAGQFNVGANPSACVVVNNKNGFSIRGQGWNTFVRLQNSENPSTMLKIFGSSNVSVSDLFLSANSNNNTSGLCITVDSSKYIQIYNVRADSSAEGHIIGIYGSSYVWVENSYIHYTPATAAGHGIDVDKYNSTASGYVFIRNNVIEEINGSQKFENASYVEFSNNWVLNSGNGGYGLVIGSNDNPPVVSGKYFVRGNYIIGASLQVAETYADTTGIVEIVGNYVDGIINLASPQIDLLRIQGNSFYPGSANNHILNIPTTGYIKKLFIQDNYIDTVQGAYDGIKVQGAGDNVIVSGNVIRSAGRAIVVARSNVQILSNRLISTDNGSNNKGIYITNRDNYVANNDINGFVRGIELSGSNATENYVFANKVYGYSGGSAIREVSGADGNYFDRNFIADYPANNIFPTIGSNSKIGHNIGYIMRNSGVDSIVTGTTSKTISIGLGAGAPWTRGDISVVPLSNLGNATKLWVDSISTSQIRVYVDTDPSTNNVIFRWEVNAEK